MLERFGQRKHALPIVLIVLFFCVFGLIMYPLLHASPKDVPFLMVSLDEGVTTPAGQINLGKEISGKISDAPESPLAWTLLDSQAALDEALATNDYYGAVVIPSDFSAKQLAAQQGMGEAPSVKVIINQGKNVMLATTMQAAIAAMMGQAGITAEVTLINAADIGGGGMAALMSGNVLVMPIILMSALCSILLFLIYRPKSGASTVERLTAYGKQLAYTAVLSFLVAAAAVLLVSWIGGMGIPTGTILLFSWLASFCIITLFIGTLSLALPLGVLVILTCFALGMSSAMLAPEMMPTFWRDWVYPWVPQRFVSQGASQIIYMGKGAWNTASGPLLINAGIGLLFMLIASIIPTRAVGD